MKRLVVVLLAVLLALPGVAHADPILNGDEGFPNNGIGPSQRNIYEAAAYEITHPGIAPEGTNDFSCRPADGQRPVILIPGTTGSAYDSWAWMAPLLKRDGLCLFTFNTNPIYGVEQMGFAGDIRSSAATLSAVVDAVLGATGASQVDLVGWSQGGGPLPTYYITQLGGAPKVHTVVGVVPSHKGTQAVLFYDLARLFPAIRADYDRIAERFNMQAFAQQLAGSEFNESLYTGTVAQPGIRYMNIATQFDTVVLPYTNARIDEPGVDNRLIQDTCPGRFVTHASATYDKVVLDLVREGLGVAAPGTAAGQCWQPVPLS
ncbi:esterase/lipase family protein [Corynebacterium epidermidicanis]|uniref:Alpha/beta hydrolase family n=1 Tax=Corynebacterium epidermidicanis TaxID=1050174 RepID=A0A0G3GXE7_9CORY|nr:alpha/beta fold hydrolase [Corynebacterium epidermidicanis]AKK04183.1 Alpha/beta hydrolase family [Corynebacterium epidermidicanis]